MGDATEVPTEYFLEQVLPPLHPSVDVNNVLEKLERTGKRSQRAITRSGRWWGFSKDPQLAGHCKRTSFANFPRIVSAIAKCGSPKGFKPSLEIRHSCYHDCSATERDDDFFPDAYMVLRGASKMDVKWWDIGIVGEYMKDGAATEETVNIRKLAWSISQAFRRDPRRRFMFGYTIYNTNMRLWFYDRSQIITSEKFNFITDRRTVVYAFLSFLFAEHHQLGWDPTITRVKGSEEDVCYDFTVQGAEGSTSVFRSLELISNGPSRTVYGSKTWVWKVVRIIGSVPQGEPMVLKDSWIQEEWAREGDTLERLRQKNDVPDSQQAFTRHFLTVVHHGDVIICTRNEPAHMDRTRSHRDNAKAYLSRKPLTDKRYSPPGTHPGPPKRVGLHDNPLSGRVVHYRIVYKEVCKPLLDGMPLSVVFPALGKACQALKILHDAGWVHRDVSTGNIMFDESGEVKLTDFEYAKRMGDDTIPELRLGTTPFIASEADNQTRWCCRPSPSKGVLDNTNEQNAKATTSGNQPKTPSPRAPPSNGSPVSDVDFTDDSAGSSSIDLDGADDLLKFVYLMSKRNRASQPIPLKDLLPPTTLRIPSRSPSPVRLFQYNPLHDLESLFWIAAHYIFHADAVGGISSGDLEQQRAVTRCLFYDAGQRRKVIIFDGPFTEDLGCLHPELQRLGRILDEWRLKLSSTYYVVERNLDTITSSVAAGLHESFVEAMAMMSNMLAVSADDATHDRHRQLSQRRPKRSREYLERSNGDLARPRKQARYKAEN